MKKIILLSLISINLLALNFEYDNNEKKVSNIVKKEVNDFVDRTFSNGFIEFVKDFEYEIGLKILNTASNGELYQDHKGIDYQNFANNWTQGYFFNIRNKSNSDNYMKYIPNIKFEYYTYENNLDTFELLQFGDNKFDDTTEDKNHLVIRNKYYIIGINKDLYKNSWFKYNFGTELKYNELNFKIDNSIKDYSTNYTRDRYDMIISNNFEIVVNKKTNTTIGYTNNFTLNNEYLKNSFYFNTRVLNTVKLEVEVFKERLYEENTIEEDLLHNMDTTGIIFNISYLF
jgi:hypothetical protein